VNGAEGEAHVAGFRSVLHAAACMVCVFVHGWMHPCIHALALRACVRESGHWSEASLFTALN
jgi:hypothetical protein